MWLLAKAPQVQKPPAHPLRGFLFAFRYFRMGQALDRLIALSNRTFSTDIREDYAKRGIAMADRSYPIPDKDALRRAIQSFGRGSGDKAKIKAHIIKRARALGATDMLPEDWR